MLRALFQHCDSLVELPPADLVGGLLLALIFAVTIATVHGWLDRLWKGPQAALTTMVLGANVLCMLIGGFYAEGTVRARSQGPLPPKESLASRWSEESPATPLGRSHGRHRREFQDSVNRLLPEETIVIRPETSDSAIKDAQDGEMR